MVFRWGLEKFNYELDEKVERVFPYKYKIKK